MDMNARLRALYGPAYTALAGLRDEIHSISQPLFMEVPDVYHQAQVKLMIVGQQTRYWGEGCGSVDDLMAFYTNFELGRTQRRSQFWQAADKVARALNPEGPERSFLWSNLVKVDVAGDRASGPVVDEVTRLGLLREEIVITRPDVVIFFIGRSFAGPLESTFHGLAYHDLSDSVTRLEHDVLPVHSYRTYHPRYLRRSGRWRALDEIVGHCGAIPAQPPSAG